MKKLLRPLFILLLLALGGYYYYTTHTNQIPKVDMVTEKCLQQSGIISSLTGQYGNTTKLCHLPNGVICELLALSRGDCPVDGTQRTGGTSIYIPVLGIVLNHPKAYNMIELPESGTVISYNGASISIGGSKTVFIGGAGASGRLYINEYPYHEQDGIDDETITLEQKNAFVNTGICPREGRECRYKKMGGYDILYAYGIENSEGIFLNTHLFFLGSDTFFIINDGRMNELLKKERAEEKQLAKKLIMDMGISEEEAISNNKYHQEFLKLLDQRFIENSGTTSDVIFYGHAFMDSIRGPRD